MQSCLRQNVTVTDCLISVGGGGALSVNVADPVVARTKKRRMRFTGDQLLALRSVYAATRWPNRQTVEEISRRLDLPVITVINFFTNARRRLQF